MKFTRAALLLPVAVQGLSISARQTGIETLTDEYLFDISLDQFISNRNAGNPNTVDWTSDGCTDSPDNPLGFDYVGSWLFLLPFLELCTDRDARYKQLETMADDSYTDSCLQPP